MGKGSNEQPPSTDNSGREAEKDSKDKETNETKEPKPKAKSKMEAKKAGLQHPASKNKSESETAETLRQNQGPIITESLDETKSKQAQT